MRTTILLTLVALAPLAFPADNISWGSPDNGMRLGIALDSGATPTVLRVLIQNTTATAHTLLVNEKCNSKMYRFGIDARSPEGELYPLVDPLWNNMPLLGIYCPVFARIDSGASYELRVELSAFTLESPKPSQPTSPDELLKAGYSLRVSGDFPGEPNSGVRWELVSGELQLPPALPATKLAH